MGKIAEIIKNWTYMPDEWYLDIEKEILDIIDGALPKDLPLGTNILSKFAEGYRVAINNTERNLEKLKE